MSKNSTLLWDTLHTVEQLEVAFEQTLQAIDDINSRYSKMSLHKRSIQTQQRVYESQIQAAITRPFELELERSPKKRKKRTKKKEPKRVPAAAKKSNGERVESVISITASCGSKAGIRSVEATATSNGRGMLEGLKRIDLTLSSCSSHCCPCCRRQKAR